MENEKSKVEWTPELEQRYQYVQKQYDVSRGIGLDLLKILLGMTITLAAVPIAFHDKITTLFSGRSIYFIYLSWIFILLALLSGFVAYLFIFEGYYYQAHFEASRWLEGSQDDVNKYSKNSKNFFLILLERMKPPLGFEPRTFALQKRCSTAELRWRINF